MILDQTWSLKRALAGASTLALAGAMFAGCSGGGDGAGGGSGAIPAQPQHSTHAKPRIAQTLHITRASIPSVMAKFIRGGAAAMPMAGRGKSAKSGGRRTMTASAGKDLVYNGGPVMTGANEYNILINCNDETCWGGMISWFQSDLFGSNMMSILSQYNASGTYAPGGDFPVTYDTSYTLQDQDIYNILYQTITANNIPTGYTSDFHVFLGYGVQECSQTAGGCYGQQYCAYHGSTDYSDIGHVLYSVEMYQDIQGCQVTNQPSPNRSLIDSTASTLSHEMFETMTDPDVVAGQPAWNSQYGEIGDLCSPADGIATGNVLLGMDTWEIQAEYDNNVHDCSYTL